MNPIIPIPKEKSCTGDPQTQFKDGNSGSGTSRQGAPFNKKVYVSFDYANARDYYDAMKLWFLSWDEKYSLTDSNGVKLNAASKTSDSVQRELEDRMRDAYVVIFLVNETTRYPFKYFSWEIEIAIRLNKPILVVNLSGARVPDGMCCPAVLMQTLALHIPFNQKIVMYALERWVADNVRFNDNRLPCYYSSSVYSKLGL